METYLNDLDAADSFQACDLAEAVLGIQASKPLNFGQYFVALRVGKVADQHILDQMVWISLRAQLQCHLHRNHQRDLGTIHILRKHIFSLFRPPPHSPLRKHVFSTA